MRSSYRSTGRSCTSTACADRTADFYAPQKQTHVLVFASPPLTPGTHTLGIVVHGDPNGSNRIYVNIDEIEVLNQE
jgi:hypothetical protein